MEEPQEPQEQLEQLTRQEMLVTQVEQETTKEPMEQVVWTNLAHLKAQSAMEGNIQQHSQVNLLKELKVEPRVQPKEQPRAQLKVQPKERLKVVWDITPHRHPPDRLRISLDLS